MKFDISTATILKIVLAIFLVWFIYAVRDVVLIAFIVLVIVSAVGPLVDRMSKYIPRFLSIIILTLVFLGFLTAIGFLIIPPIVNQISQLSVNAPSYLARLSPYYQNWQDIIIRYQDNLFNLSSKLGGFGSGLYSTTVGFIGGLVAIVTIFVISIYMLLEGKAIEKMIEQYAPLERKQKYIEIFYQISEKMGKWLRGQFVLMLAVGILDGVALGALGVPYALTLAVWGGLTEVIPYVGPWLGLIPAAIVAFTISPLTALFVVIAFILIQQLEGQFLVPKIMGRAVGLSPVIIILAMLCGAKLMGILGILVAVPVAAAISVIIQQWPEIKKLRN